MNESKKTDKWINPLGGLGDMIIISSVLKQSYDLDPKNSYCLCRRTGYTNLLKGHPAIKKIGFAPENCELIGTDYWGKEELGSGNQRAYQILARIFGLKTPIEEKLFLHNSPDANEDILYTIPFKKINVVIAPNSDSPRKEMAPILWHQIVERLTMKGVFIIQMGKENELYIKNSYTLQGVTSPRQAISIMSKCDLVITSDNFMMHASQLVGVPAVVLWGPTHHDVYGYQKQIHLQSPFVCEQYNQCIGPKFPDNYATKCPLGIERHCMNSIPIENIFESISPFL